MFSLSKHKPNSAGNGSKLGFINIENLTNKLRSMREKLAEVGDSSDDSDDDNNAEEIINKSTPVEGVELSFVIDTNAHNSSSLLQAKPERKKSKKKTKSIPLLQPDIDLDDTYLYSTSEVKLPALSAKELATHFCKEDKLLAKSVITAGFEQQHSLPAYKVSQKKLKKDRRVERSKTKGDKWFHLPATELTEEYKNDLSILQMRSALDPKRFYKKNDLKVLPKYFQVGTVIESAADFYHARVPKKQRKRTIVEELLADAEFRKFNKRKFNQIHQEKSRVRKPFKAKKRKKE